MKKMIILVLSLAAVALNAGPLLKITPPTANFGKFSANLPQQQRFVLSNPGDELLIIEKIKVSCGCSAAKVEKNELKPGESTVLYGEIKPESIEGPFAKAIFIHSNAANGSIQMLTLNGEAQSLVKILPQKMIYVGVLGLNQRYQQDFLLKTSEKIELGKPTISGSIVPEISITRISDFETKVSVVIISQEEKLKFKAQISIPISSPKEWSPLSIILQGDIK